MNQVPPPASELTLAATPNAVAWARRHTIDILQHWRFPAEGIEVARLLVSELATNAIQHARPPVSTTAPYSGNAAIGTIILKLWPTSRGVLVAVSDHDPCPPTLRASDSHANGGRGLLLTQAMANRWGYYPEPSTPGKTVWAEVPTQPKQEITGPAGGSPEITPLVMGQILTALREL
ncbi:ATP-binding protein [Streptomyces sp. NBC_01220]|uniref:ATP-binding protein n=1 Tax=Streptomyces sp. NBC_01220 TaxID=2903781 RepID=UPI00352CA1E7|nr:ATP-binding protein [Streptomyces sp. NBC_01220]